MMNRIILILPVLFGLFSCQSTENKNNAAQDSVKSIKLDAQQAKRILDLPLHCLTTEYPNKLGQVIGSAQDLKTPKQLRPVFYGCFDWHSSVHGYWSVIKILKTHPDLDKDGQIRQLLNQHITPENVQVELAFFQDKNNLGFERTYGWAWLFKLQEELLSWNDTDARRWAGNLQPLVDILVDRYQSYLPKLVYPIRSGQHDNSAFGFSLSLDYARAVGNKEFENILAEHAKRLYTQDKNCDLAYEPSGSDFLSPCLEEALVMSKILQQDAYKTWLKTFMPQLFEADFSLKPAVVKDRTDGKLVHLDGLNFSRATCLNGIAKALPELHHLKKVGHEHLAFSLPNISNDDYMGSHWLGTFALYALAHQD